MQVGDPVADKSITPKEALMPEQYVTERGYSRPVIEINATTGGSDLIAEACAAFASIAKLFREEPGQEDFANAMTKHARQLYEWMKTTQGSMYSETHPELKRTYPSQVRPHPLLRVPPSQMHECMGLSSLTAPYVRVGGIAAPLQATSGRTRVACVCGLEAAGAVPRLCSLANGLVSRRTFPGWWLNTCIFPTHCQRSLHAQRACGCWVWCRAWWVGDRVWTRC